MRSMRLRRKRNSRRETDRGEGKRKGWREDGWEGGEGKEGGEGDEEEDEEE